MEWRFIIGIASYFVIMVGKEFVSVIFGMPELSILAPDPLPLPVPELEPSIDQPQTAAEETNSAEKTDTEQPRTYTNAVNNCIVFVILLAYVYFKTQG